MADQLISKTLYLSPVLKAEKLKAIVREVHAQIVEAKLRPKSIVVRGHSGVIVGSCLALKLNAHLVIVRKQDEKSHSGLSWEGYLNPDRYIIVDDLIETGKTMVAIDDGITQQDWNKPRLSIKPMAVVLYNHDVDFRVDEVRSTRERLGWLEVPFYHCVQWKVNK